MNSRDSFRDATLPEMLAAYADGELSAAERGRVEEWLAANPNSAAELETQKRFNRRLFSQCEEPSAAAWKQALLRIQIAVANPPPMPANRVSRRRLLAAVTTIAVAVLIAVVVFPRDPAPKIGPGVAVADELAVATPDDVEILRILEADVGQVVVGEPPLRRALVLASLDDVEGLKVVKDTDGMMPMVAMSGPNAPMIVAPMTAK
jgi:hypothetical protein